VERLALTDHDTMAGVPEAMRAGAAAGVAVVPGIELSVRVPHGSMHLLGYFGQAAPLPLAGLLDGLAARRRERAARIVRQLADLGAPVDLADVEARAAGPVGRPHVAEALIAAGHVADRREAFERYLADGAPAYVPSAGLSPDEALAAVVDSGGAPVLAHPASLALDPQRLEAFVRRLAERGLRGIEVHRPEHLPAQRGAFGRLARRAGLVAAGGSDFHRAEGPFGLGDTGDPPLPADALERLFET
jgi:predicted metal-dependent phosphoesterase TrpH